MPAWLPRAEWTLALAATGLVLLLHARLLSRAGELWRDEVNSLVVATQPTLGLLWARLDTESFPWLHFALLRAWCAAGLGNGDLGLRCFGLIFGLLILGALWLNRRVLGPSPPLLSLGLFAASPVAIRWGDSVRGYGLAVLTSLLAFSLMFRAVSRPRLRETGMAVLAAVASVQALYQNAVLLFAMGVAGAAVSWTRGKRLQALVPVGVGAVAALSLVPYAGIIARSHETTVVSVEPISLGSLFSVLLRALGLDPGLQGPVRAMPSVWIGLFALAVPLAALRLSRPSPGLSRRRRGLALYCLVTLLVAGPLYFAMLLSVGFRTQPWYYLTLMGLVACCMEAILDLPTPGLRLLRLCGVGAVLAVTAPGVHEYLGLRQTNVDQVVRALGTPSDQDLVVVVPWYYGVSFNRYYRGAAPWTMLPPLADRSLHRPDLVKAVLAREHPVEAVFERVQATLAGGHRLYIVGSLHGDAPARPPSLPPAPRSPSGWWQGDYSAVWATQLKFDLMHHARSAHELDVSGPPVIPYEAPQAWVVEGWR